MPTDFEIIKRLLLTLLLSGMIGLERQFHRRDAGLRTHILVALGSALIMLTSLYVFDIYKEQVTLDPVRIAAGVVTGIGFLGAGTIIRSQDGVRGLTTAASLWVAAGLGLAVGVGFNRVAVYVTVLVLIVLLFLRYVEGSLNKEGKNGI